jgi:hypothetical protein
VHRFSQTTRDANEPELVQLGQRLGIAWWSGPPLDGWTLHRGVWLPVEIKTGEREGYVHEYTPNQRKFLRWAAEHAAPVATWRSDGDVLASAGARRTG